MVTFEHKGNFNKTKRYLRQVSRKSEFSNIEVVAERCLTLLKENTPKDSGLTADSWYYEIIRGESESTIQFCNSNIQNGVNVVILVDYGHATPNGRWVEGKHFISPTVSKVYLDALDDKWKELTKL